MNRAPTWQNAQKSPLTPSRCTTVCRPDAGFTLLEVLVCVVILASIMMSMFAAYTHFTIENRRSRNRTMAAQAAQMVLESIIASPYDTRMFHGLNSEEEPPEDSPVKGELLAWRNTFADFPVNTAAQVKVEDIKAPFCNEFGSEETELVLCPDFLRVTVEIHYHDHGREAMQELSLLLEPECKL